MAPHRPSGDMETEVETEEEEKVRRLMGDVGIQKLTFLGGGGGG